MELRCAPHKPLHSALQQAVQKYFGATGNPSTKATGFKQVS
jgi:hypothetical protein